MRWDALDRDLAEHLDAGESIDGVEDVDDLGAVRERLLEARLAGERTCGRRRGGTCASEVRRRHSEVHAAEHRGHVARGGRREIRPTASARFTRALGAGAAFEARLGERGLFFRVEPREERDRAPREEQDGDGDRDEGLAHGGRSVAALGGAFGSRACRTWVGSAHERVLLRPMIGRLATVLFVSLALACGEDAPAEPTPAPEPSAEPTVAPEPAPVADAFPNEACARVVVVAWQGATAAPVEITRSKDEARERATQLLGRVDGGESLAAVASAESDAPSSRARGGAIGTFARDEWPELFGALKEPIFAAGIGMRTPVVEAPFGWVFAERCPVEKVHTKHILIRYRGARNAPEDLDRSQEAARTLAAELRQSAIDGRSFEELAREHSEDGSAERGGDLGSVGRGLFQPPFEEAAFALPVGGVSDVVETVYGYHVIQRVE